MSISKVDVNKRRQIQRLARLEEYQLGISGWRAIFKTKSSHKSKSVLSSIDREIFTLAALAIGKFFLEEYTRLIKHPDSEDVSGVILLARDSRATGKEILSIFERQWQLLPLRTKHHRLMPVDIGIQALPQIAAHTRSSNNIYFYLYVSASHNPPEHNGIKIGNANGEVIKASLMTELITRFKQQCALLDPLSLHDEDKSKKTSLKNWLDDIIARTNQKIDRKKSSRKEMLASHKNYAYLMDKVAFSDGVAFSLHESEDNHQSEDATLALKNSLRQALAQKNFAIACDYNGSARLCSVEQKYLRDLNIKIVAINKNVGHFAHRIVPEGRSLADLKRFMQEKLSQPPFAFPSIDRKKTLDILFGYMPDCDGDRGNVVLYDMDLLRSGKDDVIFCPDAQTTFALALTIELAFVSWRHQMMDRTKKLRSAVVVNGPTSLRVDKICRCFGVELFRAEVGEANVLALAKQKIQEGYQVRFVGEGSNGGNITFPSTVRDPLSTVMSLIKLLFLKQSDIKSTADGKMSANNNLYDYILKQLKVEVSKEKLLPQEKLLRLQKILGWYTTTSIFEEEALIRFKKPQDQAMLKRRYEKKIKQIFLQQEGQWKKKYGFVNYKFVNYEGIKTSIGENKRSGKQDGGLKILFEDANQIGRGFFWMRGSRTEPVFRICVDVLGDKKSHDELLDWHRKIVLESSS